MRQVQNKFIFQDEEWWLFLITGKELNFSNYIKFRWIYMEHEKIYIDNNYELSDFYETLEPKLNEAGLKIDVILKYDRDDLYKPFNI